MMKLKMRFLRNCIILLTLTINLTACEENKINTNPFEIDNSIYDSMKNESIADSGNNYRIKRFLEKYKSNQDVYIAAIGGSVTEGGGPANYKDGYFYQFARKLSDTYKRNPAAKTIINDAGLSGTSSALGCIRYQSDVVDCMNHTPDLLIIEFAVNDYQEPTYAKGYESIIRQALLADEETAVIVLCVSANYGNSYAEKAPAASFYKLPIINMQKMMENTFQKNIIKNEDYYTDTVHPKTQGHEIIADCIINLIQTLDNADEDSPVIVPAKSLKTPDLGNLKRISGDDENVKIIAGGFNQIDNNTQQVKKTNSSAFPQNWHHPKNGSDESFKMEIFCNCLIMAYKEEWAGAKERTFGKAQVFVDGKLYATYDGGKDGGWNNTVPVVLIDKDTAENHTVEIKMDPETSSKAFTICTLGYSK